MAHEQITIFGTVDMIPTLQERREAHAKKVAAVRREVELARDEVMDAESAVDIANADLREAMRKHERAKKQLAEVESEQIV